jgi:sec-independent protein translocase protein TatA
MGGLSWWHWLIILAVFILLFGAKKLPDAARGLGRSLRILKSEVSAMHDDDADKKAAKPSETDATAKAATPVSEITATPIEKKPVVNGIPVSEPKNS